MGGRIIINIGQILIITLGEGFGGVTCTSLSRVCLKCFTIKILGKKEIKSTCSFYSRHYFCTQVPKVLMILELGLSFQATDRGPLE